MADPRYDEIIGLTDELAAQADATAQAHTAETTALQSQVSTLQTENTALKARIAELEAQVPDPDPDPEPEPTPTTKIGASFKSGENLPAVVKSIGVHRFFFQPGDFTRSQTWAGQASLVKAYTQYGCRTFSISLKPDSNSGTAFNTPDNIRRFLDTVPADIDPKNILLTFYHEHDGNIRDGSLTIARYRQGSEQLANLAHEGGHRYGPIHNGSVYDASKTPKWGLYSNIWTANEANVDLYDFWGVDCYSPNYEPAEPRMNPIKTYADNLGLPVLVGEMASPIDDVAKQTAWARGARAWALKNTRWAMWWSSEVNPESENVNWRLSDGAAREWFGLA